jgi:hypothetical protein
MTRQLLGLLGIVLAVFGLANDSPLLIWAAAAAMGASIVWRIVGSRSRGAGSGAAGPPEY